MEDDSVDNTLDEYVLDFSQRRKRAMVMKKYARKMGMAKQRLSQRMATGDKLKVRARKRAIEVIRKKVAGEKGEDYANLSPSEKAMIDARVQKKMGMVQKLATKLLPKVRRTEMERVASLHKGVNEEFETFLEESELPKKRYHMAYDKKGALKYDRRFRAFKHIIKNEEFDDESLMTAIDEAWNLVESVSHDESKIEASLRQKAESCDMDFETINEVFEEGMYFWLIEKPSTHTPQQWAFEHVNAYIANHRQLDEEFSEAYERTGATPVIPPESNDGPGGTAVHVGAAIERAKKTRSFRAFKEDFGAGFDGTDTLLQNYKADTPGETGKSKKPKMTDCTPKNVNEEFEALLELSKPEEISKFRYKVRNIKDVDARSKSWSDSLPSLLGKYGFKLLGAGKYASVFGHATYPYVLKVFMKDSAYLRWIKFAMDNQNNPYVPKLKGKVIKITPIIYAMRLEKLTPGTFTGQFATDFNKWDKDSSYKSDDANIQSILDFFAKNKDLLDLHGENVMMRGKQLVVIDPFYNWFGKKNPGAYTIDPDEVDPAVFGLKEELTEESDVVVSQKHMKEFEKFIDRMFEKYKIDFDFTKHFGERMSDDRNKPGITMQELADLIIKIYKKKGNPLKGKEGSEVVVKDIQSDLNIPFVIDYNERNDEFKFTAKTIMRKRNFSTPNPIIKY